MVHPICGICQSSWRKEKLKFFSVPRDALRRKRWNDSCGVNLKLNAKVCEKHFLKSDYINPPGDPVAKITRLLPGAVPSVIVPPESSHKLPGKLKVSLQRPVADKWRLWCRLCAKEDRQCNKSVFVNYPQQAAKAATESVIKISAEDFSLTATIEKYFNVNIKTNEDLPKVLCSECFSLVTTLSTFGDRVTRVQEMFDSLHSATFNTKMDLEAVRKKYGLLDEDSEIEDIQEFLPEVFFFETEPEINEEEAKIYEIEEAIINPLEQPLLNPEIEHDNIIQTQEIEERDDEEDPIKDECDVDHVPEGTESSEDDDVNMESVNVEEDVNEPTKSCKWGNSTHPTNNNKTDNIAKKPPIIYACTECPRQFQYSHYLRQHMRFTHYKIEPLEEILCTECARMFTSQEELDRHAKIHLPLALRRDAACPYCEKKFTADSLRTHIRYVHANVRPVICEECGKALHTIAALKKHLLTHTDCTPFKCDVCQKEFKHKERLNKHLETHDPNKLICAECGLQLNSRATLQQHFLVHSDEKRHKCDYCGRAFKRSKELKSHLIVHAGLKPYSCDFCGRTFANANNCRGHKRRVHPIELAELEASGGATKYTLNIPKLEELKALSKVAGNLVPVGNKRGERNSMQPTPLNLTCKVCGLKFKSRSTYYQHLLVHSDVKKHKCDYCGRAFKLSKGLKSHLLIHTGLKPYVCNFCNRAFSNGPSCRSHKKRMHPEELAALEASGGGKTYTLNIPKLVELKALTKAAGDMLVGKPHHRDRFSADLKLKLDSEEDNDDVNGNISDNEITTLHKLEMDRNIIIDEQSD